MSYLGKLWTVYRAYSPEEARKRREERKERPLRYGAFVATYRPPNFGVRRPRNDVEAQKMYNHIRTVAYWLDAAPVLADLGLPFRAGIDDIISLVPIYGDIVSGVLQLYQVWMSFIFGVPRNILMLMIFNVLLDVIVGIVPLIGDLLDNLFKSNLRNLALLEDWLLSSSPSSNNYHILLMPQTDEFLPLARNTKSSRSGMLGGWGSWFGFGATKAEEVREEREAERVTGRVKKTRRMDVAEAGLWDVGGEKERVKVPAASNEGESSDGTATGTRRRTRASQRVSGLQAEPLD